MAPRKEKKTQRPHPKVGEAYIENAGEILRQPITATLTENYMPYAMSVIVSRAIPEIDGFKPSHRKLLYTMYKMGLLTGHRTKSANVVGETMKLNPHGDQAIYETMVRLTRGNEALLHPFVDSKGNFGKAYSRDMAYAASRYTEVKLDAICAELFRDIDQDTVDFADNYDNTMKEPTLLPVSLPAILVNANMGIAVGMASSICPFNLTELCEATIGLIRNEGFDLMGTLTGPDFPGGGQILYNREELEKIYETGRGSVKVRAVYQYDKAAGCIEITQIPPTTTVEAIMDKVVDLIKAGKIREISDMRDETDLGGLKIAIDLKRGADADKLMQKLYRMTPLEDSFSCNFNVLISGMPVVLGVRQLILEWVAFRTECIRRRTYYQLARKREKLHLLRGLEKILLDIDKAIAIVRETQEEREVVPNLMIGFGIDKTQAEFVAEIRLRQLNREYILKRTEETSQLEEEIARMEEVLADPKKQKAIIVSELREVEKKYGQPRKSAILYDLPEEEAGAEEEIPDYPVHYFFTREGYFKKITPQSLRMSGEQKLKEGDEVTESLLAANSVHLLFFTNQCQVYKARGADFEDGKASQMGDYLPAKLSMAEGETPVAMVVTADYRGFVLFFFENGKAAKVDLAAYETKTNRKKLVNAYSGRSPLVALWSGEQDREFLLEATGGRRLIVNSALLAGKSTKDTQGVQVFSLRKNARLAGAVPYEAGALPQEHRYRVKSLPAAGALPGKEEAAGDQMTF